MKKLIVLFALLLMAVSAFAQTPPWQWATKAGGSSYDFGFGITIDAAGNTYVTGRFRETATFGSYSLTSSGDSDIFVAKMDANGNWQWATKAGGIDYDSGYGITIDDAGNSYVTGVFEGTATFGSYLLTSNGYDDVFVAKMDANGDWQWAIKAGGIDDDSGSGITIDAAGNTYVTGRFRETATFGSYSLTSNGERDVFVAKMDANGDWQWAIKGGGIDDDCGYGITIDAAGNTYVTGTFSETATFGSYPLTSNGSQDIFVAKIDANGDWQWVTKGGGIDYDSGSGITIDAAGNTYVTGTFSETATFGDYSLTSSGDSDIFVAKMDANGDWQWVTKAGGSSYDFGFEITIDAAGNTYVTGKFEETATFGSYLLTSNGYDDVFVAKMVANGDWQLATKAGGIDYDSGHGITIDADENTYVAGSFSETATFGSYSLTSSGERDVFVAKLKLDFYSNFTASPTLGYSPLQVNFSDQSSGNIILWEWDFQNDGTIDSNEQNPSYTYQNLGSYSVSLTVTDENDSTDTIVKEDYIYVEEGNTIDGYAYLENQTQHDGIEVYFEMQAPDDSTYTVYTDNSGYYNLQVTGGFYDITYSKDGYYSENLYGKNLFSNTTLNDITLIEHTTTINVPAQFDSIQTAIDNTWEGDTVLVDTGTYVENINFNGKNITVASLFLTTQDTSYISQTIIDGDSSGSVVTFESEEDSTSILTGFTLENGNADYGGGIFCSSSSPSLQNVTISGNSANNYSESGGGGIFCYDDSSPSLVNVTISNNTAYYGGGIFCSYYSSPSLENVIITDNTADYDGGGIYCDWNSSPSLVNVTISNNTAEDDGGGIDCYDDSSPTLVNTIVSDNTGNYGIYVDSGDPSIEYSDFYNNENGNFYGCDQFIGQIVTTNINGDSCDAYSNIQENPLFADTANGNYNLSWTNYPVPDSTNSPCIDAGDPSSPLDPDGTIADMGAYYYNQNQAVGDEPQYIAENSFLSYPNPITTTTNKLNVSFSLKTPSKVNIKLYNIKGQLVTKILNDNKPSGSHTITSNINNIATGIYFIKMDVDGKNRAVKKMVKIE